MMASAGGCAGVRGGAGDDGRITPERAKAMIEDETRPLTEGLKVRAIEVSSLASSLNHLIENLEAMTAEIKQGLDEVKPDEALNGILEDVEKLHQVTQQKVSAVAEAVEEHVRRETKEAEEAWEKLREEKDAMAQLAQAQRAIVRLNIGGQIFTTSRQTLLKEESMLSAMFSGRHAMIEDEQGSHFIDRSPKHFDKVLNYLRDGVVEPPADASERNELLREAAFYQLGGLIRLIDGTARVDMDLGPLNVTMRDEENHYRSLYVTDRQHPSLSPYVLLQDVFAQPALFDPATDEHAKLLETLPKLRFRFACPPWRRVVAAEHPTTRQVVELFEQFKSNFDGFSGGLLKDLNWKGVFAAGGSVVHSLLVQDRRDWHRWYSSHTGRKDVDLFLYGMSREQTTEKIRHIYQVVKANHRNAAGRVLIYRSQHAITFHVDRNNQEAPQIQLILRLYSGLAEVLMGFDLDCVCFGYDGEKVWCLPRGRRAINSMMNVVDQTRQSQTYEYRLAKYARRGFRIGIPGLDPLRIDIRLFACKEKEVTGLAKLLHIWKDAVSEGRNDVATSDRGERTTKVIYDREVLAGRKKHVIDMREAIKDGFRAESDYDVGLSQIVEFSQVLNCFSSAGVFPEETFDPSLARTFQFVFSIDDVETVLKPRNPVRVPLFGAEDSPYLYVTAITDPVERSFITVDPGRQYIGSFHPLDHDFFKDAYEPPAIAKATPESKSDV